MELRQLSGRGQSILRPRAGSECLWRLQGVTGSGRAGLLWVINKKAFKNQVKHWDGEGVDMGLL